MLYKEKYCVLTSISYYYVAPLTLSELCKYLYLEFLVFDINNQNVLIYLLYIQPRLLYITNDLNYITISVSDIKKASFVHVLTLLLLMLQILIYMI